MAYAPDAAFGKTAFADFASRGIKMSEKMDIVLQSDFGLSTGYVASMYGVIRSIDKEIAVYDLNHEIRPFDMKQASQMLAATVKYWPADTVFVSVVDPGVGTARIPCVAELKSGQYIVTPDNGTLTDVAGQIEAVRKIDEKYNRRPGSEGESTFHGRDIFAYCAAKLASGIIRFDGEGASGVGEAYPVSEIVKYSRVKPEITQGRVCCVIENYEANFGGIALGVTAEEFAGTGMKYGDSTRITISKKGDVLYEDTVLYGASFGSVGIGEPILYHGSTGPYMFLSLNKKSFVGEYLTSLTRIGEDFAEYRVRIQKIESR
jgi:S-adenosylmethionine hydrolase